MEILVCFQHNFVMPCGVMLRSLIVNNTGPALNIHAIINKDVTFQDRDCLNRIVHKSLNSSISYYVFNAASIDNYPGLKGTHFSEANYYRLFCASILPSHIDKVLYLDSDMIINDSIDELWHYDINEVALAAVINPMPNRDRLIQKISDYKHYFNSGVMLINLKYWREHYIENGFVDFIKKDEGWIKFVDQDVLNAVLQHSKMILPIKFNLQEPFLYKKDLLLETLDIPYSNLKYAVMNPAIVHFTGSKKPWMKFCGNPYRPLFWKYQKGTIWYDESLASLWVLFCYYARFFLLFFLHVIGLRRSSQFSYDWALRKEVFRYSKRLYNE